MEERRIAIFETQNEGHFTEYLGYLLRALQTNGYSVWLFITEDLQNQLDQVLIQNVKLVIIGKTHHQNGKLAFHKYYRHKLQEVVHYCHQNGIVLLHLLYLDIYIIPLYRALRAGGKGGLSIIGTQHWSRLHRPKKRGILSRAFNSAIGRYRGFCLRRLFNRKILDHIIVHRELIHRELLSRFGLKPERFTVIPYFIPPVPERNFDRGILADRYNCSGFDRILLLFGGWRVDKGADLLIRAVNQLHSQTQRRLKIIIAGTPLHFSELKLRKMIDAKAVDSIELIPGYLSNREKEELFFLSDGLLLPYRPSFEGESGPLNEAIARGKTIIASNIPIFQSIIGDNQLGLLYRWNSTKELCKILKNYAEGDYDQLLPVYRNNMARVVQEQSVANFQNQYIRLYQQFYEGNRQR
ncbi:glycosyltransferase family 4 protein [bacterium]|nr:glycosyltransferase family 4 protein [bacterium]